MKIIVVGLGKVGEAIIRQLVAEGHDITVIDTDKTLAAMADNMDVAFMTGNAMRMDVLREAGCADANLFIAVTAVDELNMIICRLAKLVGANHTIARVRNPEYLPQVNDIRSAMDIDMCVNPELATTTEIANLLLFPSAMTVDSFVKANVEIVSVRMKEGSKLCGLALYDLQKKFQAKVLICAVERGDEVFIPNGDFVLQAEDRISVIAEHREIEKFFKATGAFNKRKIKRVMIVGLSRIGYYLTTRLAASGLNVTIIEQDEELCHRLAGEWGSNVRIVLGDGSNSELLSECDMLGHDAFVALTGLDEENMILSMYAARQQTFSKVIAKVNRQTFLGMVRNTDVETYVSPKLICANQIVQYARAMQETVGGSVLTLHTIVDDKIEAVEFEVKETSRCRGILLKDIEIRPNMLVACITRNGAVITPSGNDKIMQGDRVIIVTKQKGIKELDDILR